MGDEISWFDSTRLYCSMALDDFTTSGSSASDATVRYTDSEIKDGIVELSKELGRTPTIREAIDCDYLPSAGTLNSLFGSWNNLLGEVHLPINQEEKVEDKNDVLSDIKKASEQNDGYLTVRKYIKLGNYNHNVVKRLFDSWTDAMKQAGVSPGSTHGIKCECQCGATLDSISEKEVGDVLHELDLEHEVHKSVPNSDWVTDFYVSSIDLWIEVDGYYADSRPNNSRFEDKLNHYNSLGLDCIVIDDPLEAMSSIRGSLAKSGKATGS